MPEKLERCVADMKLKQRGKKKKVNPWAVCVSSTGLKPHRRGSKKSHSELKQ